MTKLQLTMAVSHYDHVMDILLGRVRAEGIDLNIMELHLHDIFQRTVGFADFDITAWFGIMVRTGSPSEIVNKLNQEIVRILQLKETREQLTGMGMTVVAGTPEQFAQIIGGGCRYLEMYNASEGFFAFQDTLSEPGMLLNTNSGIFFEFIPIFFTFSIFVFRTCLTPFFPQQ